MTETKRVQDFYRVEVASRGNKPAYTFYILAHSAEDAIHDIMGIWRNGEEMGDGFWDVEDDESPPAPGEVTAKAQTTWASIVEAFEVMNECADPEDHKHVWAALLQHCTGDDLVRGVEAVLGAEFFNERGNYTEDSPLHSLCDALSSMPPGIAAVAHPRMCPTWTPTTKYDGVDRALTGGECVWSWDLEEFADDKVILVGGHGMGFRVQKIEPFGSQPSHPWPLVGDVFVPGNDAEFTSQPVAPSEASYT